MKILIKLRLLILLTFIILPAAELYANQENIAAKDEWMAMTPEEKKEFKSRFKKWQSFPENRKVEIQKKIQEFNQLSPETRERIKANFKSFKKLSPEKREDYY